MSEFKNSPTFRLFKRKPSLTDGIASLLDLGTTFKRYTYSSGKNEADTEALSSDWQAVGNDLKIGIEKYEQGIAKTT